MIKSINEIDFSPKPGKAYWVNCHREWREEVIYFLMVDRFHDSRKRHSLKFDMRHPGFGNEDQLQKPFGGTLQGIINNIDYIKNLGSTAIWLSPVFENNPESYHGYAIQNYMDVDKRWGNKKDLEKLVDKAHGLDIRVFLDIVLHHSGDNWSYPFDYNYYYFNGQRFPLDEWREKDRPIPVELRNMELYNRKGQIINFDNYPETQEGDFFTLKTFRNDGSPDSEDLREILAKIHCYWIRETDVDGFRLDAVKHMKGNDINRFCSTIREYAYSLGKRNFFLFGEIIGDDETGNPYIGPKILPEDRNIYYGLDSILDHPLHSVLAEVIKGNSSPNRLIQRYSDLQKNALSRGRHGEFLVTYIDDHDQVGMDFKHRFGHNATTAQVVAGMGFLICALGAPCIYYGTEQGFEGNGMDDRYIREGMFNPDDKESNVLNQESWIFKRIAVLAHLRQKEAILKFGRMYFRETSKNGLDFQFPDCEKCLLAFSRILHTGEILVVYNSSPKDIKEEYIAIDTTINKEGTLMQCIYGNKKKIRIEKNIDQDADRLFIKVKLKPMEFLIFKNH
ncbi:MULTISPECIES: alpha-amylase family glycosyl hydrolase [Arenibacter]|uniref:Alpha-amylase n=1 Tax=Arenibacter echinorum TaxID=440515 RepID=A0A327R108_9FLAO|nr:MULTISPECIES: alpha-amylase family glycosyl hydrolase [Arenibacter]MCK0191972.1 alpha-amylase family glycosyl hydrolase [Arenibacter sp. F20364]RAJ10311.1 alpha-amylase [Arenibacter echinorum]